MVIKSEASGYTALAYQAGPEWTLQCIQPRSSLTQTMHKAQVWMKLLLATYLRHNEINERSLPTLKQDRVKGCQP